MSRPKRLSKAVGKRKADIVQELATRFRVYPNRRSTVVELKKLLTEENGRSQMLGMPLNARPMMTDNKVIPPSGVQVVDHTSDIPVWRDDVTRIRVQDFQFECVNMMATLVIRMSSDRLALRMLAAQTRLCRRLCAISFQKPNQHGKPTSGQVLEYKLRVTLRVQPTLDQKVAQVTIMGARSEKEICTSLHRVLKSIQKTCNAAAGSSDSQKTTLPQFERLRLHNRILVSKTAKSIDLDALRANMHKRTDCNVAVQDEVEHTVKAVVQITVPTSMTLEVWHNGTMKMQGGSGTHILQALDALLPIVRQCQVVPRGQPTQCRPQRCA